MKTLIRTDVMTRIPWIKVMAKNIHSLYKLEEKLKFCYDMILQLEDEKWSLKVLWSSQWSTWKNWLRRKVIAQRAYRYKADEFVISCGSFLRIVHVTYCTSQSRLNRFTRNSVGNEKWKTGKLFFSFSVGTRYSRKDFWWLQKNKRERGQLNAISGL